ncbi:MAG: amidohydrolase family protein [Pyrinomonadaceae bacterium]
MNRLFVTLLFLCAYITCQTISLAQSSAVATGNAANTTRYAVLMMGQPAGVQTTTSTSASERQIFFEFNDRGRGPKMNSRITLGPDSTPTLVETNGNDYFKGPVAERFSLSKGQAVWKNKAEQGTKVVAGHAFYISFDGSPEEGAFLAQALLAAPGGSLPLLPEGEAHIERVGELKVVADGQTRTVVQYNIAGLSFTPFPIWLDEDRQFFASVSSWLTVIRAGWEASVPVLLKTQDELESARDSALAKTLSHHPQGALVFKNANLFDAETMTTRPHTTVVINGNRITAVGPDAQVQMPVQAEVIDAGGRTLLPGLWDMHVHLFGGDGLMHMAAGVTDVRDLGNDSEQLLALRRKFDAGTSIGPHVLMAALIDGRGPYTGPTKNLVDTEEEARAVVEQAAKLGYVQIKIYSSIKPELVPKIVELAHSHGLRVSGHVPAFMNAEQFVRAGVDEIQHTNFLFLNFLFDTVKDTRTPVRFTAVAEHAAELDLQAERVKSFVQLLRERKIVIDPTIGIFEGMFTARPGTVSPDFAAVADRLPPQVRRGLLSGGLPVPEGKDQRFRDSFQALLKMVKTLYDAGIPIVAGTDSTAGFALHRELELYVAAGIPAPKVLQMATLGAARVMKRDAELGSLAPGKLADLILVDGDPSSHISDIRRVSTVVKDGVVYQTAALYQAIGVRPVK